MRTSTEPDPGIPIYLATLSPKMLALTGEIADGWLGTSFVPEGAAAYLDPLRAGAERAGGTLADLDLCQGAEVAFAADEDEDEDEDEDATMVAARKAGAHVQPRRHGQRGHQLLQRRLQPPRLGRGRRAGPRAVGGGGGGSGPPTR